MPSAAKNDKAFKEKKSKNLAVLAKTPRLIRFFSAVAVDCIALNYLGKHKQKMVVRGIK